MMQINRAMRAHYRGSASKKGVAIDAAREISFRVRAIVATSMAGALTLPWALTQTVPPDGGPLPLWAPYGTAQQWFYAAVYLAFAVVLGGSAFVTLLRWGSDSWVHSSVYAAVTPSDGPNDRDKLMIAPSSSTASDVDRDAAATLSIRFLIATLMLRCTLSSVVLALNAAQAEATGTGSALKLILIVLNDGQGVLTFLLFGLQPEMLEALKQVLLALGRLVPLGRGGDATPVRSRISAAALPGGVLTHAE